jgi:hypothetical protein
MAVGATLNVGDILEVRFTTSAPVCPFGPCDTLIFNPQEFGSYFATNVTASVFDGTTLLGTYFSDSCCVPTFRSSSSLFQVGSATIDFTGIDSGTIDGIIHMSIATGYLTWPSPPTPPYIPYLTLGHATGPGVVYGGTGLEVTGIDIFAPEPPVIETMLGCLGFLLIRRRRAVFLTK